MVAPRRINSSDLSPLVGTASGTVAAGDDSRIVGAQQKTAALIQAATGGFWSDDATPGRVHKITDRVLIGGAINQNGNKNPGANKTWVGYACGGYMTYFDSVSTLAVYSQIGAIAAAFAARSSDIPAGVTSGGIAVAAFNYNDNTAVPVETWALYGTAVRLANAGSTIGLELDIGNAGTTFAASPYAMTTTGNAVIGGAALTAVLWLGSGGEYAQSGSTVNATSMAIGIVSTATGATHNKGIVFQSTALKRDGNSMAVAVEMATGHAIQWTCDGTGTPVAVLRSDVTNTGKKTTAAFTNSGFSFYAADGTEMFRVGQQATAGNFLYFNSGPAASYTANIGCTSGDLSFTPSTGILQFGNYTASALTATGYVSFKTADGTSRKLLVA